MGIKEFFENLFKKKGTTEIGTAPNGTGRDHSEQRGRKKTKNEENPHERTASEQGDSMVCVDCGSSFVFLSGEQKFFKMRGLTPPKRCPTCRAKRKQKRNR